MDIHSSKTAHSLPTPWGKSFLLGFQHVLLVMGSVVILPALLSSVYGISMSGEHQVVFATTLSAAVGTYLQLIRKGWFGFGHPMFISSSGAYLGCAHYAVSIGGVPLLATMGLFSIPIQLVYAYFFRFLRQIVTPTVGGVITMLAVLGLLQDAILTWAGETILDTTEAYLRIGIGFFTIAVLIAAEWMGGRKLRPWCLIIGMGAGTFASWLAGITDFSHIAQASWFGMPSDLFTMPVIQWDLETAALLFTFSMASFVTAIKYTGDAMALQKVEDPDLTTIDHEAMQGGLYAATVGSLVSGVLGGMPVTSHSANIPLLQMTGGHGKRIGIAGSIILALMAFCPKALMVLMTLPEPVMGATAVILVAHLFATGIMLAASEGLTYRNGLIVGLSLVMGLIAESGNFFVYVFPSYLKPLTSNGFAVGGLTAILLSLAHNLIVERWDTFRLTASDESWHKLTANIARLADRYGVDKRTGAFLNLCCEEVFAHMMEELADAPERKVTFRIKPDVASITVEIMGRKRLDQLDKNMTFQPEAASDEELKRFGLFLLHKVAEEVRHVHISGYTFVTFRINAN